MFYHLTKTVKKRTASRETSETRRQGEPARGRTKTYVTNAGASDNDVSRSLSTR